MKSGENGLVGPGDNNYGRSDRHLPVTELTPDLADKIFKQIKNKIEREDIAREEVLRHLKQLKAEMGKMIKKYHVSGLKVGVKMCMDAIDRKMSKISGSSK